MAKVALAVITVLAVVAFGGLLQLPARALRAARGLIPSRHTPAPAQLTAP